MAGTVVADIWKNGDGTENYKCRAWVNFNGTGTVAIRASGNVSSITDNGTGTYTVNFTTAMADLNYVAVGSARTPTTINAYSNFEITSTTQCKIINLIPSNASLVDVSDIYALFLR